MRYLLLLLLVMSAQPLLADAALCDLAKLDSMRFQERASLDHKNGQPCELMDREGRPVVSCGDERNFAETKEHRLYQKWKGRGWFHIFNDKSVALEASSAAGVIRVDAERMAFSQFPLMGSADYNVQLFDGASWKKTGGKCPVVGYSDREPVFLCHREATIADVVYPLPKTMMQASALSFEKKIISVTDARAKLDKDRQLYGALVVMSLGAEGSKMRILDFAKPANCSEAGQKQNAKCSLRFGFRPLKVQNTKQGPAVFVELTEATALARCKSEPCHPPFNIEPGGPVPLPFMAMCENDAAVIESERGVTTQRVCRADPKTIRESVSVKAYPLDGKESYEIIRPRRNATSVSISRCEKGRLEGAFIEGFGGRSAHGNGVNYNKSRARFFTVR